jgi:transglutaminase-like putative cysteine protease
VKPAPLPILSQNDVRWLAGALGLVIAPMFLHLTLWVPIFAMLIGTWRVWLAVRNRPLPGPRILVPLTLAGAAGIVASNGGGFGRDASVALLTLMLAMKLLESSNRRDATLLISLSWFLSITTFLFTQTLLMGLYLVLPVCALVIALIGISHPNGTLPFAFRARLAGSMLAQALPVMLVLFFLFPRLAGPLWRTPSDATKAMTGLSESMSPGSISELSISDEPAFRAEFTGTLPVSTQRYWRGPVLWHFDGRTWRPGVHSLNVSPEPLEATTNVVDYTVTLEPHNRTWLFALDVPTVVPAESILRNDHQLISRQPVNNRMRYQMRSVLSYQAQPELDERTRLAGIQLPRLGNLKARELALGWAEQGLSDGQIVQKALDMFRTQEFVYTLNPPRLESDPVDGFLFNTRRGFCEHYAGSFVFLMRAAGVPARVVTGYQGGTVNPLGNYMIIRQSDAHAWSEVWLQGRGWVRIDPTAAVSPSRIESGLSQLPAGEPVPLLARGGGSWMARLYLGWDAVNNRWNQWVLGYNQERQMQLLQSIFGNKLTMYGLATATIGAIGLLLVALSWSVLRNRGPRADKLELAYRRFQRKLSRRGVNALSSEGPMDYGKRAALALPQHASVIGDITQHYARLRYGSESGQHQREQLERKIRKFKA